MEGCLYGSGAANNNNAVNDEDVHVHADMLNGLFNLSTKVLGMPLTA